MSDFIPHRLRCCCRCRPEPSLGSTTHPSVGRAARSCTTRMSRIRARRGAAARVGVTPAARRARCWGVPANRAPRTVCHPAAGLAAAGSRKVAPGSGFPSAGAAVATKPCAGWKCSQENRRAGKRGPVRAAPRGESRISGKERLTDHRRHETPHTLAGHPPQLFSSSKIQLRKDLRFHTGLGCSQEPGKD